MLRQLRPAALMLLVMTLITGIAYPLLITMIANEVFPWQAGGSLIVDGQGNPLGSELIGQPFDRPEYFWDRLSATLPVAYTPASMNDRTGSSGSNLGPLNPALFVNVKARIAAIETSGSGNSERIPVDLITSSASGLDPHISPAAALFQASRVARARNLSEAEIRRLIAEHTEGRTLGILGEPRVNVLKLNFALDRGAL